MTTKKYSTDMLYYSPFPDVACSYLSEKISQGGVWTNIFGDTCQTQIVSPSSMTLEEYKAAWLRLTGDCWRKEERYTAMTTCPLLTNLFGICEIGENHDQ